MDYHTFFDQFLVSLFDKYFCPTFINQVIIFNKAHCSNCS